jgi:amidase
MKYIILICLYITLAVSCQQKEETAIPPWIPYDESEELAQNADHESRRMQFKLIQSQVKDKNEIWRNVAEQIKYFSEEDYQALTPLILDMDIPTLQKSINSGELTYERLTQWYLYRIVKYENNRDTYLNAIIDINPDAVAEARKKDRNRSDTDHLIYGMPVLLKDNINASGMPTTAGAHALLNNNAEDAFITQRIKEKGGIILGKTSLSEWANYLCLGCPNGYSAVGGQTLNAYGRKQFDTGGSSSGSGVAIAANYAAAAVGTETSGSILSPSSKSSLVGLKPTIGLLSRGGIVPISSTLDTPGPMTRSVVDNAILLSAMSGEDSEDQATRDNPKGKRYLENLEGASLNGMRFGVNKRFLEDSIYRLTVEKIVSLGAEAIEFDPVEVNFDGFGTFLSADMKVDLPAYIERYASNEITFTSVEDIVNYNKEDTLTRIPYGQGRFEGILEVDLTKEQLDTLKARFHGEGPYP